MSIPKHYKLIEEHPHSYEIHDERDGRSFHVAKSGLNLAMHGELSKIQRFADGGDVSDPADMPANPHPATGFPLDQDTVVQPNAVNSDASRNPASIGDWWNTTVNSAKTLLGMGDSTDATKPTAQPAAAQPSVPSAPVVRQPAQVAPATNALPPLQDLNSGLATERTMLMQGLASQGNAAAGEAKAYGDYASQVDQMLTPQQIMQRHQATDDQLLKKYMDGSIDPDRYWKNQGTGSKITAALGLILGGAGAHSYGGRNLAAETINNAIQRDIEAQQNDQSKDLNLWKMNREATQDDLQANLATQNQMLNAVKAKALQYSALSGSAESKLRIAPVLAQLDQQMAMNNYRRALLSSGQQGGPGGRSGTDPAQLVPMLVPEAQQKDALKEIKDAQTVSQNQDHMLQQFDQAAKDVRFMSGGHPLYSTVVTPPSIKALGALEDPLIHDADGRVNEFEKHDLAQLRPQAWDSDDTIAKKRQAYIAFMNQKRAAPTAKAYGIDLNRYQSTANAPSYSPGQVVSVRGQMFQVGNDGNSLIPVKQ